MVMALLVIDMQQEMQQRLDEGREAVNADAAQRIARLAAAFRAAGRPVIHIRHRDSDPASPFHESAPGFGPIAGLQEGPGETVLFKSGSSAFASTPLEAHLRERGLGAIAVSGAVAGFCVTSSVRAATDLGFAVTLVSDAVLGFDLPAAGLSAQAILDVTLATLGADFATLAGTDEVIAALEPARVA